MVESLAYLHLALSYEAPANIDPFLGANTYEPFAGIDQKKFYTTAGSYLLSATLGLGALNIAHPASAALREGDSGAAVTALQQQLRQMGYFSAKVTGYFGTLTTTAVTRFQAAKGLTADGIVGVQTESALRLPSSKPKQQNLSSAKPKQLPSLTGNTNRINVFLQEGDRSAKVQELQTQLKQLGYFKGTVNGLFGSDTTAALLNFQRRKGLTADGIAGPRTLAAVMNLGTSPRIAATKQTSTLPALPSESSINTANQSSVLALQKRLQAKGFYKGPLDGILGIETKAALEAAQKAYGVGSNNFNNNSFITP
jgi:peptidoglycan hydrolase-like protein with peptidoglycan-binding domain